MQWLYPIRFQWLEWLLALLFLLAFSFNYHRKKDFFKLAERYLSDQYDHVAHYVLLIYFVIALFCKIAQLYTFQLHSLDFWLFEDLLDQVSKGGWMVTRFAVQNHGFVQHGAVHVFWPLYAMVPLVWLLGSLPVALAFNPLWIALSGWALHYLTGVLRLPKVDRLIVLMGFLFSWSVSEIMMQEMHPEVAYPFFVFSIAASLLTQNRLILYSLCFLLGTFKEDTIFIGLPVLVALRLFFRRRFLAKEFHWHWVGAAVALSAGYAVELTTLIAFQKGWLGVSEWRGLPVQMPLISAFGPKLDWSSFDSISTVFTSLTGSRANYVYSFVSFLFDPMTLCFLGTCFWVLLHGEFWVAFLPYALAFALIGDKARLTNYYAVGFVSIFWLWVTLEFYQPSKWVNLKRAWVWLSVFAFGSVGLTFYLPRPPTQEIHLAAQQARLKIENAGAHQGVVLSPFLGEIPKERIESDRPPEDLSKIDFMLLTRQWAPYEISMEKIAELTSKLEANKAWKLVDVGSPYVSLWLRSGP